MARRVHDDLIVLDVHSGQYFELNDVGALVWDRLDGTTDVDGLVDAVLSEYEVDRSVASKDVQDLLGELIAAGLVVKET
jgi:hypothetical protein